MLIAYKGWWADVTETDTGLVQVEVAGKTFKRLKTGEWVRCGQHAEYPIHLPELDEIAERYDQSHKDSRPLRSLVG